jgi:hypothetical protein
MKRQVEQRRGGERQVEQRKMKRDRWNRER